MVDVIGRYSKPKYPEKTLDELTQVLRRAQSETKTPGSPVQVLQPRNVRKRLGDAAILRLVADYRKGDTTIVIMERYGLSKTAVLKLLRDNGVKMRRQALMDEQVKEAVRLYDLGLSVMRVAERLDVSYETTRLALIAASVRMRPRGGSYTPSS